MKRLLTSAAAALLAGVGSIGRPIASQTPSAFDLPRILPTAPKRPTRLRGNAGDGRGRKYVAKGLRP